MNKMYGVRCRLVGTLLLYHFGNSLRCTWHNQVDIWSQATIVACGVKFWLDDMG